MVTCLHCRAVLLVPYLPQRGEGRCAFMQALVPWAGAGSVWSEFCIQQAFIGVR